MRLTSDDPVSAMCAEVVKTAAIRCLQLPQRDMRIEAGGQRIRDLVQAVLDGKRQVPRVELYCIAREVWEAVRHQVGMDPSIAFQFRSIVTDCLRKLRTLQNPPGTNDDAPRLQRGRPSGRMPWQTVVHAPLPLAPLTGSPVPWLTSVHSPLDRGAHGDPKYPGNCSGLIIEDLVRYFRPRRVLDPLTSSGTCQDVCDPKSFEGLGWFDFVWLHPPYWRQKIYSDDPRDLSNAPTLEEFLDRLRRLIRNCAGVLSERGLLAILMGNYSEQHRFLPLTYFTMQLCLEEGLWPACMDIVRFQHNASRSAERYDSSFIPNVHEVCLILERGKQSPSPPQRAK